MCLCGQSSLAVIHVITVRCQMELQPSLGFSWAGVSKVNKSFAWWHLVLAVGWQLGCAVDQSGYS